MDVNDNAGNLTPRGVLGFIASRLAPTERRTCVQRRRQCGTITRIGLLRPGLPPRLELACP
ncbi:hypothetical protein B0D71_16600 [Pseudomonas laurylsulfativorans]|uniref:Uncharacterized protein n=1 Tax=Pseudomonas laurylsulfativorans TaxID=1943631 RepID=A0A2S3VLP9_9PSED|nr:hypothetical protein B0D71_16600 [Pseudomonas laurylsulfativorans]